MKIDIIKRLMEDYMILKKLLFSRIFLIYALFEKVFAFYIFFQSTDDFIQFSKNWTDKATDEAFESYVEKEYNQDRLLYAYLFLIINCCGILLLIYFLPYRVFYVNKIDFLGILFTVFENGNEDFFIANIVLFSLTAILLGLWIYFILRLTCSKRFLAQVIKSIADNPILEFKRRDREG
eukprot:snap_masked-scaffold_19-processed-gene-4.16-mRNA-1 protein AED:1.00 eAED:1.00 QI:0/0/0/0/1/1/3/0/178